MPISHVVSDDSTVLVIHFSGRVTVDDVLESDRVIAAMDPEHPFRSLMLFDRLVDLSDLDADALDAISLDQKSRFRRAKLKRVGAAAVVDGAIDARLILPLWNAICERERAPDLHLELFSEVEPALDWLGVPKDQGLSLVSAVQSA